MKKTKYREGDMFNVNRWKRWSDYEKTPNHFWTSEHLYHWCMSGIAIIEGFKDKEPIVKDMYGSDKGYDWKKDKKYFKYVGNIKDFKETDERTYYQHKRSDRFFIPVGVYSEKYLVKTKSKPSDKKMIEQLREEIKKMEHDIEWNTRRIEDKKEEIKSLKSK